MLEPSHPNYRNECPSIQQAPRHQQPNRQRSNRQGGRLLSKFIAAMVATSVAGPALAQQSNESSATAIPTILVTLGLEEDENLITSPFSVLNADEAFQGSSSLGDLLDGLPGVHADSFGGGSSRPVIR